MKKIIIGIIAGVFFVAEIALLKTYDVAPVGAGGTDVGFSTINLQVHNLTGVNMEWYKITNYLGYLAIAICLLFAFIGLVQLIRRKSLFEVDREILALGGLFVADIALYVLFEKVIINYRPIFVDGTTEPEASFPSSHTLLAITVLIATAIIIGQYVRSRGLASLLRVLCVIVTIVAVGGRLWCGAHWLTDIVGGVLLSISLLFFFSAAAGIGEAQKGRDPSRGKGLSTAGYKPKH